MAEGERAEPGRFCTNSFDAFDKQVLGSGDKQLLSPCRSTGDTINRQSDVSLHECHMATSLLCDRTSNVT